MAASARGTAQNVQQELKDFEQNLSGQIADKKATDDAKTQDEYTSQRFQGSGSVNAANKAAIEASNATGISYEAYKAVDSHNAKKSVYKIRPVQED